MAATATRPMSFSIFTQFSMSHTHPGLWRLPEAAGNRDYTDLDSWVRFARLAEESMVDAIFLADGLGAGGHHDGDLVTPIREGQYMRMDPSVLVGALAAVTEHLGFVLTSAMIQDHPFHFARRMSTLDHLSRGRVGWNVVTSFNPGAWMNLGLDPDLEHGARYDWAEEYMHAVYKLWEGSWERDAGTHDLTTGVWADAAKVHEIDHESERYRIKGPHMVEPSPQGTPVIVQAGASPAGKAFAARHAEMQFIATSDPAQARSLIDDVRARARELGRDGDSMRFAPSLTFVVGSTEAEAKRRADDLLASMSVPGVMSKLNSQLGIDFEHLDPDTPLGDIETNGIQSFLDTVRSSFPDGHEPTLRDVVDLRTRKSLIVGAPEQIADRIEALGEAGVDAVLVSMMTRPGSLEDFAEHLVPVLQDRGLMRRAHEHGTLRERLFGGDALLPESHPAAQYRSAFAGAR